MKNPHTRMLLLNNDKINVMFLLQTPPYANYILPIILFVATQFVIFITFLVTAYVRINSRLRELEVRVEMSEKNEKRIQEQLTEILNSLHGIELKLEKKQNRPNN
jgi:hypothetical protein